MQESPEHSDFPEGSNYRKIIFNANGLHPRPVEACEWGEGFPYAPNDWPSPGDKWGWRVGKRRNANGYWADRYLYPPDRLQKAMGRRNLCFPSKSRVREYICKVFPNADVDAFFSSFQWRIPYIDRSQEEVRGHMDTESTYGTRVCKAGNRACSLQTQKGIDTLQVTHCDICCKETDFCRDCCCILCCESVDWAFGGYSFIRCEATLDEEYICGHVAHVECALRSQLAGTVESINLDVEYYCRRCDKKTDLILHVSRLLQACESLDSSDEVEKILNLGSCILYGSRRMGARSMLDSIDLVLGKLKSGICPQEIWKAQSNTPMAIPEELSYYRNGTTLPEEINSTSDASPLHSAEGLETDEKPSDIPSVHQFASLKLENVINQVLQNLRQSQESEYKIAEQKLNTQKETLLSLYQQLDNERSEMEEQASTQTEDSFEDLCAGALKTMEEIKSELKKIRQMKQIAKGFGRTQKEVLKEHFGLAIED